MDYRRLGKSGLQLSVLSLGSWVTFKEQVDSKAAIEMMAMAYDAGVNFFDNAEAYADGESEVIMGQALKALNWSRDSYTVSSKVFWGGSLPTQRGLSRKHVFDACHAALKRLQVDYLDLYFCHRPDLHTPIEETVWAMNDLIRQGKVLYWGTSEWSAKQIMEAHQVARQQNLIPPTMEQPQYNMFERQKVEEDYKTIYRDQGLGTTIWSPLASGLLTGKYQNGVPEGSRLSLIPWLKEQLESEQGQQKLAKINQLGEIAKEMDMPLSRMAISWCVANPDVTTVILGASRPDQLKENLKVIDDYKKIDASVLEKIEEVLQNKPKPEQDFLA